MSASLAILGLGTCLFEPRSSTEPAIQAGVAVDGYRGWPVYCEAPADVHPSDMGVTALEAALAQAEMSARDLDLILYTGTSRDYLPSWSVATEISRRVGAGCVGLDIQLGCLGTLMGLEVARGWLTDPRRRAVAVVSAERWAYTVDRTNRSFSGMWAHSDGAAVLIVGTDDKRRSIGTLTGVSLVSEPDMNDFILVKHGGTRFPVAPAGQNPFARSLRGDPGSEMFPRYLSAFDKVLRKLTADADVPIDRLVVNQVAPSVVNAIETRFQLPERSVPRTAERHGHLGGADLVLGIEELRASGSWQLPIVLASSCPYAFAAAAIV